MKQRNLFDFPTEKVKRSPTARVIRPPRKSGEEMIAYTPKHREVPRVAALSEKQVEDSREMRRRGIEYHRTRSER